MSDTPTYEELLDLNQQLANQLIGMSDRLQEILELHKKDPGSHPYEDLCTVCGDYYPCPTVAIITKHLEGK